MIKYCKALVNLGIAFLILLFVLFILPRLAVFFMPFIIGWVISIIASPIVEFFERKLKVKRKAGSAITIIFVLVVLILIIYLLMAKLFDEASEMYNSLPSIIKAFEADLQNIGKNLEGIYNRLPKSLQSNISSTNLKLSELSSSLFEVIISTPTISAVGNFVNSLPSVVVAIVMSLLSSYFFVADKGEVSEWLDKTMPKSVKAKVDIMKNCLFKALGGYIKAQLKIEFWVFLIVLIGLTFLKVNFAILISLGIAILDFLPFFGTGTVMVPWAIIKFLNNDYKFAVWLLIVWGVGQLVRQIIQPKIVGDSVGVAPIPTLLLLFIGFKFGSFLGMILSVPIGIIVYTMYKEGAFETTQRSFNLIINGINNFRQLDDSDVCADSKEENLPIGESKEKDEDSNNEFIS